MIKKRLIGAKISEDEARVLHDFCVARGETVSTVIRRLVFSELGRYQLMPKERQQALGVWGTGARAQDD